MSINPQSSESAKPVSKRRSGWIIFVWVVEVLVVLAVLAAFVRNPFEFTTLNYLYYLGQKNEWQQVYDRLGKVPETYRANEKYPVIRLETLMHLSRNADAVDFAKSQKGIMTSESRQAVIFRQLAGFAFLLAGRDQEAAALFARHSHDPLSQEMASLIAGANVGRTLDARKLPELAALVEDRMTYPDLYAAVVQYLFGRDYLRREDFGKAAEILEDVCSRYPTEFVFERDLGMAQMGTGRIDLSVIHLMVASRLLSTGSLYRPSESERGAFQSAIFARALDRAESHSSSDFWRLMRCVETVLPNREITGALKVNPHPFDPSELWEWSRFGLEYEPERWGRETSPTLSVHDGSLLAALNGITQTPPVKRIALPLSPDDPRTSPTMLEVVPISSKIAGLVRDGDSAVYTVPFTTGSVQTALVLCEVRGSLRQGIPGGCAIQVGMDKYYLSPSESPKWYALPLPLLTAHPVPVRFEFNSDFVAGYTGKEDKDDRNLYVLNILAGFIKKQ